jgi:hypothetical protein
MTTETKQERYRALTLILRLWDRRLRWQQTVGWLGRSLIPALALGIALAVLSRLYPLLENAQVAVISSAALALSVLALLLTVWFWPRTPLEIARRFDRLFNLRERLSTAIELVDGRIRAADELASHQIEDAYDHAQTIHARERLPLVVPSRDWIAVAALTFVLTILLILPNDISRALRQADPQQQAIAAAADDMRDAIGDIATDTTLDQMTREQLLEALQTNLQILEDERISPDEALATLSDMQALLDSDADALQQQADAQQAALDSAFEALADPAPSDTTASAEGAVGDIQPSGDQAAETLAEMLRRLEEMAAAEAEAAAAAERLEQAAQALEQTAPEAAQALRDAAQALREGDTQAAQEAMQQAMEQFSQAQREQEQTERSAEQLSQTAQRFELNRREIAQDSQQQDAQQQASVPGDEPGGEGQSDQGMQLMEGDGDGETEGDTQLFASESQGDEAQAGAPSVAGPPQPDTSGSAQIGDQPGDLASEAPGSMETGERPEGGGAMGQASIYEEVFAPRRPEIEPGDSDIVLQPDSGDVPLIEGDFGPNPLGRVTVPYNQVFGEYADTANRALDQGYIPLGLRDVVRSYFTSLAPRTTGQE